MRDAQPRTTARPARAPRRGRLTTRTATPAVVAVLTVAALAVAGCSAAHDVSSTGARSGSSHPPVTAPGVAVPHAVAQVQQAGLTTTPAAGATGVDPLHPRQRDHRPRHA